MDRRVDGLLYSMSEFWRPVEMLLAAGPLRRLVEVGVEAGDFSARLMDYCDARGATYYGVDPRPDQGSAGMIQARGHQHVGKPSLEALAELPPADAYFVDGDHNYYTVRHELELILGREGPEAPLVFLHDVGWPWARRDLYYDTSTIPPQHVHPHTSGRGVAPWRDDLVEWGFVVFDAALAQRDQGPRNGVLTAVEDALAAHPQWRLLTIPAVFGLGVLFDPARASAAQRETLAKLEQSLDVLGPLMARLEASRLENYVSRLQLQHELVRQATDAAKKRARRLRGLLGRILQHAWQRPAGARSL